MGSQIHKEIGLDLCPSECGTKAILLITLPRGLFTSITIRLVLMAVISFSTNLILTLISALLSCHKEPLQGSSYKNSDGQNEII